MLHIDAGIIVIFFIVWILLAVLIKVFYNPLRKVMRKREDQIVNDQKSSEKAFEDFEQILLEIEESIKAAKASAQETREKIEREALKEKERMLAEISREYRAQVDKAKEELDKQLKGLKKDLESKSEVIAEKIEQRLLH